MLRPFSRANAGHPRVKSRVMLIGGVAFAAVGILGAVASRVWFLIKAFQVHIGWGLACIFLPFASLVFLIMHWEESFKPFLANFGATCLAGGGLFLAFMSFAH